MPEWKAGTLAPSASDLWEGQEALCLVCGTGVVVVVGWGGRQENDQT